VHSSSRSVELVAVQAFAAEVAAVAAFEIVSVPVLGSAAAVVAGDRQNAPRDGTIVQLTDPGWGKVKAKDVSASGRKPRLGTENSQLCVGDGP